mmetsp:Transcript_137460/g.383339  ORF Transcript_137460/g.383339 Transcript_137460/m.383339 type:complete len:218 (+) Transcript_137460:147-800(+)
MQRSKCASSLSTGSKQLQVSKYYAALKLRHFEVPNTIANIMIKWTLPGCRLHKHRTITRIQRAREMFHARSIRLETPLVNSLCPIQIDSAALPSTTIAGRKLGEGHRCNRWCSLALFQVFAQLQGCRRSRLDPAGKFHTRKPAMALHVQNKLLRRTHGRQGKDMARCTQCRGLGSEDGRLQFVDLPSQIVPSPSLRKEKILLEHALHPHLPRCCLLV